MNMTKTKITNKGEKIETILKKLSAKYLRTYPALEITVSSLDTDDDGWGASTRTTNYIVDSVLSHYNEETVRFINRNSQKKIRVDYETKESVRRQRTDRDLWLNPSIDTSKEYLNLIFAEQIARYFHQG